METLKINNGSLCYDKEATIAAYKNIVAIKNYKCACQICRNYYAAAENFPTEIKSFFKTLGVDLALPCEVYDFGVPPKDGEMKTDGWYHLVGTLSNRDDTEQFAIADGYKISFSNRTDMLPEGFPEPVVQMYIDFTIPWVLDENYGDFIPVERKK